MGKMNLENQISKKEQEIAATKMKLKKLKNELRELQLKLEIQKEKEKAEFNARVVDGIEQRIGKITEENLNIFLRGIEEKTELNSVDAENNYGE